MYKSNKTYEKYIKNKGTNLYSHLQGGRKYEKENFSSTSRRSNGILVSSMRKQIRPRFRHLQEGKKPISLINTKVIGFFGFVKCCM